MVSESPPGPPGGPFGCAARKLPVSGAARAGEIRTGRRPTNLQHHWTGSTISRPPAAQPRRRRPGLSNVSCLGAHEMFHNPGGRSFSRGISMLKILVTVVPGFCWPACGGLVPRMIPTSRSPKTPRRLVVSAERVSIEEVIAAIGLQDGAGTATGCRTSPTPPW